MAKRIKQITVDWPAYRRDDEVDTDASCDEQWGTLLTGRHPTPLYRHGRRLKAERML